MAAMAQTSRTASRAPEKKKDQAQRAAVSASGKAPAYLQKKMALSQPGDRQEQQADQVAQQVARAPREPKTESTPPLQRASLEPGLTPEKQAKQLARKPVPAAREVKPDPAKASSPARKATAGAPADQKTTPAKAVPGAEQKVARAEDGAEGGGQEASEPKAQGHEEVDAATQAQIEARKGTGQPLPEGLRTEMEGQFSHPFDAVRTYTDPEAARLCAQLRARAFTVGSDIFFASGAFAPDSEAGRELLAHELTHVVQQGVGLSRIDRAVTPAPSPMPASGTPAATALDALSVLDLPPIKHRHAALYAGAGSRRAAGYSRSTSREQVSIWNSDIQLTEQTIETKLKERFPSFVRPTNPSGIVTFQIGSAPVSSSWRGLRSRLLIPDWDRAGQHLTTREDKFQVDHMVELQVFGDTTGDAGNVIGNMELLKGSPNASSGSTIKNAIYDKVIAWLTASDPTFASLSPDQKRARRRNWLASNSITFTEIRRSEGRSGLPADWWTRAEIEAATPLEQAQPAPATQLRGSPGTFVLASGVGGVEVARYTYSSLQFQPATDVLRLALAGIRIQGFNLDNTTEVGNPGDSIGSLSGTWNLPNGFRANEAISIPLVAVGPYCGALGQIPALNTDFSHLSPVCLPTVDMRDGHLYAQGTIEPSIPLLRGHPINVTLDGNDLTFEITYSPNMVSLPIPGVTLEDCSLALFYSTQRGFGGGGSLDFSVPRLGNGELEVQVSQGEGFSATGGFHFDTQIFDQADVRIWYRNSSFGGEGTLGITQPDKIRGIRSAQITAGFNEGTFSANGNVQPNIPGVQEASLHIDYGEETGLTMGGSLQLAANPAIRSGAIDVTVNKLEDVWKVRATGTAQPAIPGLNSELTVNYEDGAFTAEFQGAFQRGLLSGNATVGVTNRTLGADGNPTGAPEPNAPLIVYGSGSATLQIAPWLQGTAGLRFAPNGEVTLSGEIGLPSSLEIFSRKEINKSLLNVAIQIPIFPGVVAEVGGNLGATAGIGPGALDQLRIGIEYNPSHEENTHITGDAHLNIPVDAGLRLAARAGIGLGITGASATGGLELGGTLGVAGAAEAAVHIDWMPTTGLGIDASASLHAEPKFKFDVSGYVSVRALGFSVYDNTWQLAAYELGSNLRFGVTFPIHYREGQPFEVSLDDVAFEVPDVDPAAVIRQLADQIF